MSSSKSFPLPLQERAFLHSNLKKFIDLLILFLLFSLLAYRLASFRVSGSPNIWFIAFVCESWFTFVWILTVNCKWSPIAYKTYPDRLSKSYEDLPAVDMFVTTADPTLEPPIVTVNTVLSLLAVEYPSHHLACYVSDDGGSPITYYALCEASKFAKLWIPFCKKYNIKVRAPFVYFSSELQSTKTLSSDFLKDWKQMKGEYIELTRKIESGGKSYVAHHMNDELVDFSAIERGNHPSIIKVISENGDEGGIPHLIYVAREKRPKNPHHYKAGAMNVLTRVSGVMTNAPFILNVDCDMFANNPEVILHGMCLLLGFDDEVHSGYVQAPQKFYGALKDDPFGNQLVFLNERLGTGIGGIQGPFYGGTGCFHRRKIIYGASPDSGEIDHGHAGLNDELSNEQPQRTYGNSKELMKSVKEITTKKPFELSSTSDLSSRIPAAKIVAACNYEFNTCWGKEIGWIYGSMTEDILTGLRIQAKGWRSAYLNPDPPAFLGNAPTGGPAALTQYKRWGTGLLEILFDPSSPLLATLYKKLSFRQCLAYLYINIWALCSVFEFCYALLPAYCLLADATFLPRVSSPQFLIPIALFAIFNISTLADYLECGLSVRTWWNNQKMSRIYCASSFLFGFLSVVLKILGLSETIFEVTQKGQNSASGGSDEDPGRFTFDSSLFFVPGTAIVLVHVAALVASAANSVAGRGHSWGFGELVCSAWILSSFWPFVRGLFGKGSYGIPWAIIWKAVALGSVFLQLRGLGQAK